MVNNEGNGNNLESPPVLDYADVRAAIVCALTGWAPPGYKQNGNPFADPNPNVTTPSTAHGNFLFGTLYVNTGDPNNLVQVDFPNKPAEAIATVFSAQVTDPITPSATQINAVDWIDSTHVGKLREYDDTKYDPTMKQVLDYVANILGIWLAPGPYNDESTNPPNEPDGAKVSIYDAVVNRQAPQRYTSPGQDDDNASYY